MLNSNSEEVVVKVSKSNSVLLENLDTDLTIQEKLKHILRAHAIVGIGEAAHGTKELFKIRCQFSKFLIRAMGYKTIVLEAGLQESFNNNKYVLYGEGDSVVLFF